MDESSIASMREDQRQEEWDEAVDLSGLDLEEAEDAAAPAPAALSDEPMFSALLRRAVAAVWGDDPVMTDFVTHVAPPLSTYLGHVAAKGGDFAETRAAAGKEDTARYSDDQSLRAHLINGLFPALHVAQTLQCWGAPQFDYYDDTVRRLAAAGYVLHDWLKLPDVDAGLAAHGLDHATVNAAQHLPLVEELFRSWGTTLGLDAFLMPVGGLEEWLHDLIFIACNTQVKWGTLRALVALPRLKLPGRRRALAEAVSRLADLLAYVGRDPRSAAANRSIRREISSLSDQQATLVYHHVAELRGVLTNLIHNAALEALRGDDCVPLLYAPSGVVYLARRGAEQAGTQMRADPAQIAEAVVARISDQARRRINVNLTGFQRDGKGMKYADYIALFFAPLELCAVGLRATLKIVHAAKKPVAGKRFAKMAQGAWLAPETDLDLPDDVRVDQLAEWAFLVERITAPYPGGKQVPRRLIHALGLDELYDDFLAVPRDARTGGVGYAWYFAAGHYLKRNPGLSPDAWEERLWAVMDELKTASAPETALDLPDAPPPAPEFDDLRAYVAQVLQIGPAQASAIPAAFGEELQRYTSAKRRGKSSAMCALCSSSYTVTAQREAAILFAPQVYSNKLVLHGSKAIRDICSICGLEMMLRQLLMSRTAASGKNFEAINLRYLYLYPTYFFTPETLALLNEVYSRIKYLSFTELRGQLVEEVDGVQKPRLDAATWQRLQPLLLSEPGQPPARDRFLRLRFAEDSPVTFFFLGVPPGRDAKDAEAWVHPALLALLLPLCLDVKVVASESPLPLLHEAGDLPQTVFLDGPHAAVRRLVRGERIHLDRLLPALNRLAVAYLVHVDNNSRAGAAGFDYRWQDIPALARRLEESSLYVFWYLKKGQRSAGLETIPAAKAALYLTYQSILSAADLSAADLSAADNPEDPTGGNDMSHARTLTELYRRFYRAGYGRWNSNSVLRPITIAGRTLLDAGDWLRRDPVALEEAVRGELHGFVDRVVHGRADGRVPRIEVDGRKLVDHEAIDAFAAYFVHDLFFDALHGNLSALRGRQLNLLKNACEVIYRDLDREERAARAAAGEPEPLPEEEATPDEP